MKIRLLTSADYLMISQYQVNNRLHISPWEPLRENGYHSEQNWKARTDPYWEDQNGCSTFRCIDGGKVTRLIWLPLRALRHCGEMNFNFWL